MKRATGDLIELAKAGDFDVIIHGCNCFCNMGAGIAKQIREEFPEALRADQETICGNISKLGSYTSATVARGDHFITIVNAYTQYNYWGDGPHADYNAIRRVFKRISKDFSTGLKIGIPLIGAGLAGGDWGVIHDIISEEMDGLDVTVVIKK